MWPCWRCQLRWALRFQKPKSSQLASAHAHALSPSCWWIRYVLSAPYQCSACLPPSSTLHRLTLWNYKPSINSFLYKLFWPWCLHSIRKVTKAQVIHLTRGCSWLWTLLWYRDPSADGCFGFSTWGWGPHMVSHNFFGCPGTHLVVQVWLEYIQICLSLPLKHTAGIKGMRHCCPAHLLQFSMELLLARAHMKMTL